MKKKVRKKEIKPKYVKIIGKGTEMGSPNF